MRIAFHFIIVGCILALLSISCAVPGDISGGPKDELAPKIIAYIPDSHLLNFKGKSIAFEFNEKIQLKNLTSQFQITPAMDEPPQISANANLLSINFKKQLPDSTTYILNFGNAIADLNESNAINDFKFIFSTGNYIDSLKMTGTVKDAYTNNALKDVKLLLYKDTGTVDLIRRKPNYYVKSNENGQYQFNNLKKDQYLILAIEDKNNNNSYDNKDERIGFIKDTIQLKSDLELPEIKIFKEGEDMRLKQKNLGQFGKIELIYTQSITSIKIEAEQKSNKLPLIGPFYNALRDSIRYFYSEKILDTLSYILSTTQSNKIVSIDTIYLLPSPSANKIGNGKGGRGDLADPLKPALKINSGLHHLDTLKLISNIPIKNISILPEVRIGKYTVKGNWKINQENPCIITSDIILAADKEYKIQILKEALHSIYETANDSTSYTIKTPIATFFGSIKINILGNKLLKEQPYIVKLMDEKGAIIKTIASNTTHQYTFNYMPPIDYTVKIEVGQYRWQTGNYKAKQQAAPIYFYKDVIKLRSDWISEIEWIIE